MRLCRALGLTIGIATFQREVDDSSHIGGSHLVRRVLGAIGAGDLVSDRDVVALSPAQYAEMLRHQDSYAKNDMIRALFERREEPYSPGTTLLIDDTRRNVEAFVRIGGHGLLVEGGQGLILQHAKVGLGRAFEWLSGFCLLYTAGGGGMAVGTARGGRRVSAEVAACFWKT